MMEFNIKERHNPHKDKYKKEDIDLALDFSKECMKEMGKYIKAIVIFGSEAKKHKNPHREDSKPHDIDLLIVINDLSIILTPEIQETYKIITGNLIARISKKIHLTTMMFTNFWELVKNGDPLIINILRDGVPLIDTGFFEPLQVLLYQGRIRPTWEAIWGYYQRAPQTLFNSKGHILQATLDLYWAVIDSAHAALMKVGEIPPSPAHVADMLESKLRRQGLINKRHVTTMRDFFHLSKHIIKREIREISGRDFDRYYKEAEEFVHTMKRIIEKKH